MTTDQLLRKYARQLVRIVDGSANDAARLHGEAKELASRIHNRTRSILGDVEAEIAERMAPAILEQARKNLSEPNGRDATNGGGVHVS